MDRRRNQVAGICECCGQMKRYCAYCRYCHCPCGGKPDCSEDIETEELCPDDPILK